MNLNYLLKALSRKKIILFLVPLITLVLAFILTRNLKDQFRSRAQLATGFTISDQVRVNAEKVEESESEAKFNNVLETLTSPKVVGFLSYSLILHDLKQKIPFTRLSQKALQSALFKKVDTSEAIKIFQSHLDSLKLLNSYIEKERNLIEYLKLFDYDYEHLTEKVFYVNRVAHTDFIDITATTENPELSAFIVNTVATQFLKYYNIVQSERTVASMDAMGKLVNEKRLQLLRKSDSLTQFKSSNGVLNIDVESKNKSDLIKEFTGQLAEEEQNNTQYRLELQNVNKQLKDLGDNPGDLSKPSSTANNSQEIIDLQQKLSTLRNLQLTKSGNSDRITKQIQDVTNQLAEKFAAHSDPSGETLNTGVTEHDRLLQRKNDLEVKVAASDQSINNYSQKIKSLSASYGSYPEKEATNNTLQHEVDMATNELRTADEKYNQAINQRFSTYNENIKQSLFGQPAVDPEPSKRLLIIGIAVFTSLLLSVFFIILLEYIDNSIKTPYIFSKEVGLPLLGVINQVNLKKESLQQLLVQGQETEKVNPEFKDLLKKIRYEMDKKNSKLFLFTSNKPGEGKTTIITALSMVLASINKRILLIDTNFSHNSLTQLFGSTLALEDFGNLDFDEHYEVINKMIGKTSNKNIDIIGCKGGNYSPSEIFLKRGFFNALGKLTVYYDYIFLEGANLNQYADTKELAEFSDSVISVFSAKSIIKQSDINSITFLKELKESFGGAILNNVELDNIDY